MPESGCATAFGLAQPEIRFQGIACGSEDLLPPLRCASGTLPVGGLALAARSRGSSLALRSPALIYNPSGGREIDRSVRSDIALNAGFNDLVARETAGIASSASGPIAPRAVTAKVASFVSSLSTI
jgi:hypothetical protein